MQLHLSSMRLSVLLIAVLAFYSISFGTQVYGSTDITNQCDLPANRSCPQISSNSQVKSGSESETTQTPLILPDLSPTREDLNDQTGDNAKSMDSNENDAASASDDNTVADNSNDEQETENNGDLEDNDGEEDNDGGDTGDGPSIIPFP